MKREILEMRLLCLALPHKVKLIGIFAYCESNELARIDYSDILRICEFRESLCESGNHTFLGGVFLLYALTLCFLFTGVCRSCLYDIGYLYISRWSSNFCPPFVPRPRKPCITAKLKAVEC